MKVALTIDDAPTISREADGIALDPSRMDTIREHLKYAGIRDCVAFVTGAQITGNETYLKDWLAEGFELGNHTFSHRSTSDVSIEAFVEDFKRCDSLLENLGAFDNCEQKWFRFPFLNRGRDPESRKKLAGCIGEMGYDIAPATTDFFDHEYEVPLSQAVKQNNPFRATLINNRYRNTAIKSLLTSSRTLQKKWGRQVPLTAYCHFGIISSSQLVNIIEQLGGLNVEWCSLKEVTLDPAYQAFNQDFDMTGLMSDCVNFSLPRKVARKLKKLVISKKLFSQKELGPRWPYV